MANERDRLQREGFSDKEVDEILRRATAMQGNAEGIGDRTSREDLTASAEAVGIDSAYVQEAIGAMRREQAEAAARKRSILIGGGALVAVIVLVMLMASAGRRGAAARNEAALNAAYAEVEKTQAQLENVFQRRHNLIPNLIAVTKAAAEHEQEMAQQLSGLSQRAARASWAERRKLEAELASTTNALMRSLAADRDTAGSPAFTRLQDELAGAENRIAVERKRYNEAVAAYNRLARSLPDDAFGDYPKSIEPFEAEAAARETPEF